MEKEDEYNENDEYCDGKRPFIELPLCTQREIYPSKR